MMGKPNQEFPNLDFIRSIAVLLVVAGHTLRYAGYNPGGWFGIVGVATFFVHTSLVLMWSLERDPHVARFYIRRAFRIYPLWIVVVALSVLVKLPTSPIYAPSFGFHHPTALELFDQFTLLFNLRSGGMLIGASWSLPIEIDMYLFLPLLFAFAVRFRSVSTLIFLNLCIIFAIHESMPDRNSTFFMCVPYFLPGIMAYILMIKPRRDRLPAWSFVLWFAAIVALAGRFGSFKGMAWYCLVLGLSLPFFRQIGSPVFKKIFSEIAKYSYGIYLCHLAAIAVGIHYLHDFSIIVRALAYFATICTLPFVLYHCVELPMIRLGVLVAARVAGGHTPPVSESTVRLEPVP